MSVDKQEASKLENMMMSAEKTGNWEQVAQELNDRKAGNFAARGNDLNDTIRASADYCNKHGFPMAIIDGLNGDVQSVVDKQNSGFIHKVGVTEAGDNQYHANNKI
jgi:hypothetical protein